MQSYYRSVVLFILTGVLFGGTFVAANAGLEYLPPFLFLAIRFDIATILLLPYVRLRNEKWRPQTRHDFVAVAIAGIITIGLTNALIFIGQQYLTSAVAAIIFSFGPILTPAFAVFLLSDEDFSAQTLVGIMIGFLGVLLVVRPSPEHLLAGKLKGQIILLGGASSVAIGSVLIRRANASIPSMTLVAWALPLSALLMHIGSILTRETIAQVRWTPVSLAALGYVSIFAAAIAYGIYFELLDRVGAIRTNLVNYLIPIIAAIGGWVFLDESITTLSLIGFGVISTGFSIAEYSNICKYLYS